MEGRLKNGGKNRGREKTLMGMFLKYMVLFCVNVVLICIGAYLMIAILGGTGMVYPANYPEQWMNVHETELREREDLRELEFPYGTNYGVYTRNGEWLYGTIVEKDREATWDGYERQNMSALSGYYRVFEREKEEICIVKYYFQMRYVNQTLNRILPTPELLIPILMTIIFLVQAVVLARHFAKNMKKRLEKLQGVTQKISENDLEFAVETTDIKEINQVLRSLERMKDALQKSLKKQWDMEEEQNRQVRALVHDIKTPLTIIKGNAELSAEDVGEWKEILSEKTDGSGKLSALQGVENCQKQILEHTVEIEAYLDKMRLILKHQTAAETETCITCDRLQEKLKVQAEQMTSPQDLPLLVQCHSVQGVVQVNLEQLKRAWGNVLGNAIEYTDSEQGVDVCINEAEKDGVSYLCAKVSDYGPGFSGEELNYAAEEFFRGDESRHDRSHQGLGLAIAKRFVEAQGGFLEIRNSEQTGGGEVTLWLKVAKHAIKQSGGLF